MGSPGHSPEHGDNGDTWAWLRVACVNPLALTAGHEALLTSPSKQMRKQRHRDHQPRGSCSGVQPRWPPWDRHLGPTALCMHQAPSGSTPRWGLLPPEFSAALHVPTSLKLRTLSKDTRFPTQCVSSRDGAGQRDGVWEPRDQSMIVCGSRYHKLTVGTQSLGSLKISQSHTASRESWGGPAPLLLPDPRSGPDWCMSWVVMGLEMSQHWALWSSVSQTLICVKMRSE